MVQCPIAEQSTKESAMATVTQTDTSSGATTSTRETTLWHSQAHMPTVKAAERVIVRGDGAYIYTDDGHRLLDAPASLWYCNVGHGRDEIAAAVATQMRALEAYSCFQQYATKPTIELAERIAALAPVHNPKVYFTSGGSDAVEVAAKLARRYWNAVGKPDKRTIITRTNAYHGLHTFGTSIAGIEVNRTGYGTLVADTARVPMNDAQALQSFVSENGADSIAAFFCEPIIGTGGIFHPAPGYLRAAQEICRQNDILFVVDEVITGFGRTGATFASERFDIEPDIMLTAKGITSGYMPLGAAIIGEPIWEPFWTTGSELVFRHGLTYSGHASACAAAHANLDIIEREDLVERVRSLESVLEAACRPLESHPLVREVRSGIGLLTAVELNDPGVAAQVAERCVKHGVLGRQLNDGSLHISPPLIITEDEIGTLAAVIAEALDSV
jgi:adenosylmethionine-8-amino-7-oxononanoate aminotransferase